MRKIAAAAAAFTILMLAPLMSGCRSDGGMNRVFKYDIAGNPRTLDPQQANEPESETIIANMFLGLTVIAQDGTPQNGAAESCHVSEDGLVYDFKLRQDIYWVDCEGNEQQCTAHDFVYGFTRLFLPETEAPKAENYFCIKNARAINAGGITDTGQLGVKAKSDFELEITLEYPNSRFLAMLAESPAMPCCEALFKKAQGKYGLSAECTPSNGSFFLKSWDYDAYTATDNNNLILRRNYKNAETQTICPSGLNFFIEDEDDFIPDFRNGETSCIAVSNADRTQLKGNYNIAEFSSITCGLAFNNNFPLFRNEEFRKALCMLADKSALKKALPDFETAEGIVPMQVSVQGTEYRGTMGGVSVPEYNTDAARKLFDSISSQLDKNYLTGAKIIAADTAAATAVSYIMQEWQRELGFYCKVETLSEREYARAVAEGNFDIAVLELSGKYNSPAAYLEQFVKDNPDNCTHFYNADFENYLKKAEEATDERSACALYLKAEQTLIDRCAFVPLYYKNEYLYSSHKSSGIVYNPFSKTVNFTLAKMKK